MALESNWIAQPCSTLTKIRSHLKHGVNSINTVNLVQSCQVYSLKKMPENCWATVPLYTLHAFLQVIGLKMFQKVATHVYPSRNKRCQAFNPRQPLAQTPPVGQTSCMHAAPVIQTETDCCVDMCTAPLGPPQRRYTATASGEMTTTTLYVSLSVCIKPVSLIHRFPRVSTLKNDSDGINKAWVSSEGMWMASRWKLKSICGLGYLARRLRSCFCQSW